MGMAWPTMQTVHPMMPPSIALSLSSKIKMGMDIQKIKVFNASEAQSPAATKKHKMVMTAMTQILRSLQNTKCTLMRTTMELVREQFKPNALVPVSPQDGLRSPETTVPTSIIL